MTRRVGCFLYIDWENKIAHFLGFGEFIGREVPDENARGLCPIIRKLGIKNPKIILDNKKIVWGGECWWSDEAGVVTGIEVLKNKGFLIKEVDIDEVRKKQV